MSDDAKREAAIAAIRAAITAWIAKGDAKSGRQLRDCLHALSGCRAMHRDLKESAMPKRRRKAA